MMLATKLQEAAANSTLPTYIEDVFSTYLYTGNGSTQTITNGIDLSTKGGMVWWKNRTNATGHGLIDTTRGIDYYLSSNTTDAQDGPVSYISSVSSTGYSIGAGTQFVNQSANNYASWTFRKQPKFFDVQTATTNGSSSYGSTVPSMTIAHSLGSVPGCVIVKRTDGSGDFYVWHRSLPALSGLAQTATYIRLNTTGAAAIFGGNVNGTGGWIQATATHIYLDAWFNTYEPGTFIVYILAHDAGGFGLTGTDNVISCGSYTGNGSSTTIDLGYEPQWLLIKSSSSSSYNWVILDNMRGLSGGSNGTPRLYPNSSGAEAAGNELGSLNATGFTVSGGNSNANGVTYIYIAIRRGPMKVPTSGTSVFQPASFTSTASRQTMGSLPVVDMFMGRRTNSIKDWGNASRLTGEYMLKPNLTDAQDTMVTGYGDSVRFDIQNGSSMITSGSGDPFITYNFHRAPSFFDEVCYTGNGGSKTLTHNLGVAPELIIFKSRSAAENWVVFADFGPVYFRRAYLDLTNSAPQFGYGGSLLDSAPTATTISLLSGTGTNSNAATYVAYLFATCAGVSKVGSYTGTGASGNAITTGFSPRFLMIKCTSTTGNWIVFDTARGMGAGSEPYLLLNTTGAETAGTDWLDVSSSGFSLNTTGNATNGSGQTYIYLAIA